jgi:hypothetical protein
LPPAGRPFRQAVPTSSEKSLAEMLRVPGLVETIHGMRTPLDLSATVFRYRVLAGGHISALRDDAAVPASCRVRTACPHSHSSSRRRAARWLTFRSTTPRP